MIIGYAWHRPTAGLAAQQRDLTAAGAERIFAEQVSSVASRARLTECLAFLEPQQASNYTVYSGLSNGVRLSPIICSSFLKLLGAPIMPSPFGVSSQFD
jgi:hypothetical protein